MEELTMALRYFVWAENQSCAGAPAASNGYIRATAPNSIKGDNNPKRFSLRRN